MPGKALRCRATSLHFGRKLRPRFTLRDELYTLSLDVGPRDSRLICMPFEVLALIYEQVDHAPSQIAFALSCKRIALVAKNLNLNLAKVSPKYAGFLPVAVFDVPALMRQLEAWMPPRLRICDHCLTARPCAQEYWRGVDGCEISHFWITKTGWKFADASWHKQVHNICPACHISCSLSDFVDCDGCRALGRLGDVDWSRVSDSLRHRTEVEV